MSEDLRRAADEVGAAADDLENAGRPVTVSESALSEPLRAAVAAVRDLASELAESGRRVSE
ncbi:hypothetical protein INP57_01165 [Saccharopolyspora sp. HNM0986]|uniref:hypothetical protein n=1 Tax=Saccharopolyspora galaxeae TaxID=2781241 RepID=UPI00190DB472|nr:hypothetical protein [Saccharopolyspora sp. HNM0986]MBK0865413.1 hypothetical protein [Saccharopolyspora sp. HNM0986]